MRTVLVIAVALVTSSSVGSAQQGAILLREAYTYPVAAGSNAHVFLAIDNFSTLPLAILRTSTSDALAVSSIGAEGSAANRPAPSLPQTQHPYGPSSPHLLLHRCRRSSGGRPHPLTLHARGFRDPGAHRAPPGGRWGRAFGKSQFSAACTVTSCAVLSRFARGMRVARLVAVRHVASLALLVRPLLAVGDSPLPLERMVVVIPMATSRPRCTARCNLGAETTPSSASTSSRRAAALFSSRSTSSDVAAAGEAMAIARRWSAELAGEQLRFARSVARLARGPAPVAAIRRVNAIRTRRRCRRRHA
jgi:hypothetical protein